jgi:flagellar biosynthesis protein FliR
MNLLVGLARALPAVWVAAPLGWPTKLVLAGLLTAVAWPALSPTANLFQELLVGVALGVTASLPFRAAQAAGATLGRAATGRGWAAGTSVAQALGDAMGLLALALFAAAGGPLQMARLWAESYSVMPVASKLAVEGGARLIGTAVSLALPGLGALLLAELLGALIVKAQPTLGGGGALRMAVVLVAIAAGVGAIVTVLAHP